MASFMYPSERRLINHSFAACWTTSSGRENFSLILMASSMYLLERHLMNPSFAACWTSAERRNSSGISNFSLILRALFICPVERDIMSSSFAACWTTSSGRENLSLILIASPRLPKDNSSMNPERPSLTLSASF